MKITHYICPRICGKTTFAKELQMEDPENTLLYTMEHGTWSWGQSMRGEKWKRIIMDEYIFRYNKLSETEKHKFVDWIKSDVMSRLMSDGELILISTSDKLYNSLIFFLLSDHGIIKKFRDLTRLNLITNEQINNLQKEMDEMRDKFLDPFTVKIIKTNLNCSSIKNRDEYKRSFKSMYGEERYKIEMEGEFLK